MEKRNNLTVPEQHLLKIAKQTLKMHPAMVGVMGGPNHAQAKEIIKRLAGKNVKEEASLEEGSSGHRQNMKRLTSRARAKEWIKANLRIGSKKIDRSLPMPSAHLRASLAGLRLNAADAGKSLSKQSTSRYAPGKKYGPDTLRRLGGGGGSMLNPVRESKDRDRIVEGLKRALRTKQYGKEAIRQGFRAAIANARQRGPAIEDALGRIIGRGINWGARHSIRQHSNNTDKLNRAYLSTPGKETEFAKIERRFSRGYNAGVGSMREGYAHISRMDKLIGQFKERSKGNRFDYEAADDPWAHEHGLPHKIHVGKGQVRFGHVKGTVAHVAEDEGPDGKPILTKWAIGNHAKYSGGR